MRLSLSIFVCLFFAYQNGSSQTVIKGKVLGSDGKPMERADITRVSNRSKFPRDKIKNYPVDENGSFEFTVSAPNLYRFWFSGAYHQKLELPIYVSEPGTIRLNIQLKPFQFKEKLSPVNFYIVRGWREKAPDVDKWEKFTVGPDSSDNYTLSVKTRADTLAYYVWGLAKDPDSHIHGAEFDYLVPNRSNGYYSVINTEDGQKTKISFALDDYPKFDKKEAKIELDAPRETKQFLSVYQDYERRYDEYSRYHDEQQEKGKSTYEIKYDWDEDLIDFYEKAKNERDPFLKKAHLTFFLTIDFSKNWNNQRNYSYDKEFAEQILEDFEPDSPLWSVGLYNFGKVFRKATESDKVYDEKEKEFRELKDEGDEYEQYMRRFVEEHPDSSIYSSRLSLGMGWAYKYKRFELFEKYYNKYMDLYGDTRGAERIREEYNPQKKIKQGAQIPEFAFELLDSGELVTSRSLTGSQYLINFWATWCGPCVGKMEELHKIYDVFKDDGFKILNISINFKEQHVYDFREKKFPMPWLNVHLEDWDPDKPPLSKFEVIAIPKTILVDKKGTIQAVNPERNELVRLLKEN